MINRNKTSERIEQSDCKKEHILDNNTGDETQEYYYIEEQHETSCNSDIYESIEVQAVKPTHCASTHLSFKSWPGKRLTCFIFGFLLLGVIVGMTAFMLLKNNSQDPDQQNTQAQVTPCTSSPCLNNGECKVQKDSYQCHCPVGFNGTECQETPCSREPCFYNGKCTELGNLPTCACSDGYNGSRCEVTPCHSSPCSNGGECTPTGSSFECSCPTGYFGKQCQGTPCHSSPCLNRGTCKPTGSSFVCSCPIGYSGKQCERTPCHSSPCLNRGTCNPSGSSFVCSCQTGYSGKQCQITPCHSSPCLNVGRCTSTYSGFVCSCKTGFSGNRCQIRPQCPYGWKMNENKCYYFSSGSTNWYSAKSNCQRRSSMLAEVTTRSKMRFLRTNAQVNGETFWLGGSDQAYEGLWRWTTSRQSFTVTDWHTRTIHEPNNLDGNEDCLNIHKKLDFEWNDDKCSNHYRFICEKSLI
ncbi:neurogenic locus Notch protein-like isoform X1 [Mytilus edulis]|uniref:neurogenic locus Notch protein-like isoform X1 n=1 Tax=Mytilus edulis TaxID=6550 RepID=UPI0039F0A158